MQYFSILTLLLNLTFPIFGATGVVTVPSALKSLVTLDTSTNPLTASFAGPNATFTTNLSNVQRFCISNGLTTVILGSSNSTSCTAGTVATFMVPAGGSTCLEGVRQGGVICLKTRSGTIGSGYVDGMHW